MHGSEIPDAFGDDRGTFTSPGIDREQTIHIDTLPDAEAAQVMRQKAAGAPILWLADDERRNREWFRRHHSDVFAVLTLSSRRNLGACLSRSLPCDAIVTDLFFPADTDVSAISAERRLSIYPKIESSRVEQLRELWLEEKHLWALDGFGIASDAGRHNPPIPVFLYSRKAALLLNIDDLPEEVATVENSYWLPEKVSPSSSPPQSRRAALIQQTRIVSILATRRAEFRPLLRSMNIKAGFAGFDVQKFTRQ